MAAPAGNQFWLQRSSHGRKPKFDSADTLWDACCEYFQWVEDNPLHEDGLVTFQGSAKHEPLAKMRAMTVTGLCIFLDISRQAWDEYRDREGFGDITSRADDIIRTQKFEGASAGLLNPNIIARDLGLSDKQELTGKDGAPIAADITHHGEIGLSDTARFIAEALGQRSGQAPSESREV